MNATQIRLALATMLLATSILVILCAWFSEPAGLLIHQSTLESLVISAFCAGAAVGILASDE